MKLYSFPAAPNPRRLHIFMAEKGIEIAHQEINLMKREQFSESFRAINPQSTVPVLITDEGETLTQVVAICDYLEAMYPDKPLLGRSAAEKGQIREWSTRIFMEGLMAVAEAFRNGNPAFANRGVPGSVDCEQIPALVERGVKRLDGFFAMLDRHLAGREYIAGDSFSMADIDAFVSCGFAGWIKKRIPAECGNLQRWHDAFAARPSARP